MRLPYIGTLGRPLFKPATMKSTPIILILIAALAVASYFYFGRGAGSLQQQVITTHVNKGPFKIFVNATGELKAKKSVKVRGPGGMRSVGIYQTTMSQLVPEGTVVKKGDFVAELDKTELASKMQEVQTEIEKIQTQLAQAKIDTTIEMKGIRDEIANLEFSMQEERLEIEKNRFEPKMIIDQSKLKLEKSERDYEQLEDKLRLKKIQSDAKIGEIDANLRQQANKLKQLSDVAAEFTVTAPEDGMVIYQKNWNGKKGPGSQVSAWDPVVAELPDLSDFISVIYVNEVDISKVKKGQSVDIKVDAFPEKTFAGYINSVANIGQELRNQDAKVFEVTVQMNAVDSVLRPAMTTSNDVLVYEYDDVLSIPLEGYHKRDSVSFVIVKKSGKFIKQEVIAHVSNDDEIMIVAGLEPADIVCLTSPNNAAELALQPLDDTVRQEALKEIGVAITERQQKENEWAKRVAKDYAAQQDFGGGSLIIFR